MCIVSVSLCVSIQPLRERRYVTAVSVSLLWIDICVLSYLYCLLILNFLFIQYIHCCYGGVPRGVPSVSESSNTTVLIIAGPALPFGRLAAAAAAPPPLGDESVSSSCSASMCAIRAAVESRFAVAIAFALSFAATVVDSSGDWRARGEELKEPSPSLCFRAAGVGVVACSEGLSSWF